MRTLMILLLLCSPVYAFPPAGADIRICDGDGDCADITAGGALQGVEADVATQVQGRQPDIRVSDNDGNVIDISSTGALQLS